MQWLSTKILAAFSNVVRQSENKSFHCFTFICCRPMCEIQARKGNLMYNMCCASFLLMGCSGSPLP